MHLDFSSFEKALDSLLRLLERSRSVPDDEDIRNACIQRFEYTYELAFKMLKRQLEQELPAKDELDLLQFKELIRVGAERGLIAMPQRWFNYRDKRNIIPHTYDEEKAREVYNVLPDFVSDAADLVPCLTLCRYSWPRCAVSIQRHVPERTVRAFSSRVRGAAKPFSDLDLVVMGDEPLDFRRLVA